MEQIKWTRDWQLGAAFVVAPIVWTLLYLIDTPQFSIAWVSETPLLFVMLVLVRPIIEEIVFRGVIQGWFTRQSWGKDGHFGISYGNFLTSVLFTALHLIAAIQLMNTLVFIPSLVFGYFRDRYHGWLIPNMLLHCFYNAGYFLIYNPTGN